jgi:hypothetical protein
MMNPPLATADTQEFTVTNPTTTPDLARVVTYAAGNITGATTINFNNGITQNATLTGNVTITFSNPLNGGTHILVFTQDATGGRTVTWPGSVVWPGGSAPTPNTAASAVTKYEFLYDGTSFVGTMFGQSASIKLNGIIDPDGNWALNLAGNQVSWTWGNLISAVNAFTIIDDTSNVGTGYLFNVQSVGSSTGKIFRLTYRGTANGVSQDTTELAPIGTGEIRGTPRYCADAGANDTYACSFSPALTAYATGVCYTFKANTANTGAATVNFNSVGAKTIKKAAGGVTTDLADNDIRAAQVVSVCYDGTNMQMQSTLGNAASGGGDTVTVNGSAVTDADFDDATPAAPAGTANVLFQTSGSGPADISAHTATTIPLVLDRAGAASSDTCSSTTETSKYSFTIPANAMSTTRCVQVVIHVTHLNNSGAGETASTVRFKFGATTWFDDATIAHTTSAVRRPYRFVYSICNRGATNEQWASGLAVYTIDSAPTAGIGNLASAGGPDGDIFASSAALTVDTTANVTVDFTWANGTNDANVCTRRELAYAILQ